MAKHIIKMPGDKWQMRKINICKSDHQGIVFQYRKCLHKFQRRRSSLRLSKSKSKIEQKEHKIQRVHRK